jgi:hypothetical protein
MTNIADAFRVDKLSLGDNVLMVSGSIDPSSIGYEAPIGSIYINSITGDVYHKFGSIDANWGLLSASTSSAITRKLITSDYSVQITDSYIGIQHTANITITLPTGIPNKVVYIKDEMGRAGQYSITIVPSGLDSIEYQQSVTIMLNYTSIMLVFGATNWSIL